MKKLITTLAVGLACAAFALQANAVPITGKVDFFGNLSVNNGGNLNTATAFTAFTNVVTVNNLPFTPSGSYATVTPSVAVTMNTFGFTPFVAPAGGLLWSFVSGANTYQFNLTSITSVSQPGNNTLTVVGMGTARIFLTANPATNVFDPTVGQFFISTQGPAGGSFTFSSTTTALPEGGSALALLGIGLVVLEVVRRKIAVA